MNDIGQEVPTSSHSSSSDNVLPQNRKQQCKKRAAKKNLEHSDDHLYRSSSRSTKLDYMVGLTRRVSTRHGLPFSHSVFAEASRGSGTRVHMPGLVPVISNGANVSDRVAQKKRRKRTKKITGRMGRYGLIAIKTRNTHCLEKHACRLVYRNVEKSRIEVMVTVDSPFTMMFGLDGHTHRGEAVYQTPRAAARALAVYCLFHMPYIKGNVTMGVPTWLSHRLDVVRKSGPVFIFLNDVPILCGNKKNGDRKQSVLLGALTMGSSGIFKFSFPRDDWEQNLVFTPDFWQTVELQPPLWKSLFPPDAIVPCSLLNQTVARDIGDEICIGNVVAYEPEQSAADCTEDDDNLPDAAEKSAVKKKYMVKYRDGYQQMYDVSDIVRLSLSLQPIPKQHESEPCI